MRNLVIAAAAALVVNTAWAADPQPQQAPLPPGVQAPRKAGVPAPVAHPTAPMPPRPRGMLSQHAAAMNCCVLIPRRVVNAVIAWMEHPTVEGHVEVLSALEACEGANGGPSEAQMAPRCPEVAEALRQDQDQLSETSSDKQK